MPTDNTELTVEAFRIKPLDSLHNNCRAVWVCKRCGNCARHCKHDDPANFHEDLDLPCSGPCQCIDCVPPVAGTGTQVFTIKPLAWERINRSNPFWIAKPLPDVQYQVGWVGGDLPIRWLKVGVREADGRCASPEEGKQIAEQHWQEYIKQALVAAENQQ